jgi:hypothetical protein
METLGRLYRRTEAGRKAWDTQNQRVPLEYRRVLGLITAQTHSDEIRRRLDRYTDAEVFELLAELENSGLVESQEIPPVDDLDFTSNLNLADLAAAHQRRSSESKENPQADLDFTANLNRADLIAARKK